MAENFAYRHKKTPYNAIIAIMEPLALVFILSELSAAFDRHARYGTSPILFFASGILPYSLFMSVSLRMKVVDAARRLPRVTTFDLIVAHVLDELILKTLVIVILFSCLYFWAGVEEALPADPLRCLAALVVMAAFGLGAGMINTAIYAVFPIWKFIYPYTVRMLLLFSGAGWVMDLVPLRVQAYMVIDPIAHAVVWFRTGVYPHFPHRLLDLEYMFTFLCFFLIAGVIAEAATKEWRHR